MANVIQELPKISRAGAGGKRGSKYPLERWFDGQPRELVHTDNPDEVTPDDDDGKPDYSAKTTSMVNMLHGKAAERGLKLASRKTEAGVAIQTYVEESNGHTETEKTETKKPK